MAPRHLNPIIFARDHRRNRRAAPVALSTPADNTIPTTHQPDRSHQSSYPALFFFEVFKNILSGHRLRVNRLPQYSSTFHVQTEQMQKWRDLFCVSPASDTEVPFTYVTTSSALVLLRIFTDLGINFKFVRHLKNELSFGGQPIQPDTTYFFTLKVEDILRLQDDQVVVVTETVVGDESGHYIYSLKDHWLVTKLPPQQVANLSSIPWLGRHDVTQFQDLTARGPVFDKTNLQASIRIPEDMGLRYGKLSGDLNPLSLTTLTAKLFGLIQPFIQGFCTVNHILKHLTEANGQPPRELHTLFVRPLFVDQTVQVRSYNKTIEICGLKGELLASGSWKCSSRPAAPRKSQTFPRL
jgi:hypothetical protein